MIQFSSENIEYPSDQFTQTLILTNPGIVQILFKVRTNNVKSIDARPSIGSIAPNSASKITIKRNENLGEGVKLQINYLQCVDVLTKDNFKELWAKHEKSQQSKTFQVRTLNKTQQKKESADSSKNEIQRFNTVNLNAQSDPNLFQSVRVSRKNLEEPEQAKIQAKAAEQEKKAKQEENILVMQKLVQQKMANKNLQQKLAHKQKEVSGLSQSKELQIQKFLSSPSCKKPHLPFSIIVVIALIFFVLGYYFGSSGTVPQQ